MRRFWLLVLLLTGCAGGFCPRVDGFDTWVEGGGGSYKGGGFAPGQAWDTRVGVSVHWDTGLVCGDPDTELADE